MAQMKLALLAIEIIVLEQPLETKNMNDRFGLEQKYEDSIENILEINRNESIKSKTPSPNF